MDEEVEEFLAHFGVRGMHWGSRKSTSSAGTIPKRSIKSAVSNHLATTSTTKLTGEAVAAAATGLAVAKGARVAVKYGPVALGTVKLALHAVQYREGLQFANELTSGSSGLKFAKTLKGAYKVTSI